MMGRLLAQIVLILMLVAGPAHARDKAAKAPPPQPTAEDLKIIAMMEELQLMDMAKDMEMIKDMDHLVEENQNERTKD
jgi:hypothetical protein